MRVILTTVAFISLLSSCVIEEHKDAQTKNHSFPDSVISGRISKVEGEQPKFIFSHLIDKSLWAPENEGVSSVEIEYSTKADSHLIFENKYYEAQVSCADDVDMNSQRFQCSSIRGVLKNKTTATTTLFNYQTEGITLDENSTISDQFDIDRENSKVSLKTISNHGVILSRVFYITKDHKSDSAMCIQYNYESHQTSFCRLSPPLSHETSDLADDEPRRTSVEFQTSQLERDHSHVFLSFESDDEIIFKFHQAENQTSEDEEPEQISQE